MLRWSMIDTAYFDFVLAVWNRFSIGFYFRCVEAKGKRVKSFKFKVEFKTLAFAFRINSTHTPVHYLDLVWRLQTAVAVASVWPCLGVAAVLVYYYWRCC